jgi:hypothetical protein
MTRCGGYHLVTRRTKGATGCPVTPRQIGAGDRNRTGDVQLGKLAMPRCAVRPCEKNRGVARDTVRRRGPA